MDATTPEGPTAVNELRPGFRPPYFVPESDEILEAGDVVAFEPGLYPEGVGMRFERNYSITQRMASRPSQIGCNRASAAEFRRIPVFFSIDLA
jgi:Xaa-Pro aminopeptidase